ncbi:MAG: DUF4469 domain-containing protein [Dysgonamonadaceae bacterium]|jgi:hypothetical protein|nr:DUF4469 domain-containing protein [Dysgonamonadaceae bacterium]
MASEEKNNVFVELYDLTLSERTDDRFGRVVTTKSLHEGDLINIAVKRRTDLSPTTLRASLDILKEIAIEEIANGASVQFGLGFFGLDVRGVFIGDHAQWNPEVNSLHVKTAAGVELRTAIKDAHVKVLGLANSGTVVNTLIDKSSGEENTRLTPGGGVNLTGSKIRIAGESADNGIRLIDQNSGVEYLIPIESVLVNDPKKVTFIVPANLPFGDYKLSLTTQFTSGSALLKEPRPYLFDYVLAVQ